VDGNPSLEAVAVVRAIRLKARQLADKDIIADNGGPPEAHFDQYAPGMTARASPQG
jgi:hypothetical protein